VTPQAVIYADVPAEVVRVAAYAWPQVSPPSALQVSTVRDGTTITVAFMTTQPAVVLFRRDDGSYLLDGPVAPGHPEAPRQLDHVWRHTIAGSAGNGAALPVIEWLPASGINAERWPVCWWSTPLKWECLGVPIDTSGVAVATDGESVWSAPVTRDTPPPLQRTRWARLLIVGDRGAGSPQRLRIIAARAADPPARRSRAVRLGSAAIPDVHVVWIAAGAAWLTGDSSPPAAWAEIRSDGFGPQFMPLDELAQGSPTVPVHVRLDESRTLAAVVKSGQDQPAGGALVTLFRLIDPIPDQHAAASPSPRRVPAAETIAATDGSFRVDGIGEADYELVAWHPQLGRGSVLLRRGESVSTIRLQPSGIARGRVLAGGKPVVGVDVISVPDPASYAAAEDPVQVKGGDARTGPDGRFSLALADGGGGELRIGGGTHPVKRIPLPTGSLPLVELGDIELGQPVAVEIVLDQDLGCDVRATGPIGRSGLSIVTAARTGPGIFMLTVPEAGAWEVALICGRQERAVAPGIIRIAAGDGRQEVRLMVR
jgi:hypothetical protein